MVLEIRKEGDPILRMAAAPVTRITQDVKKLAQDMLDTMYAANGVGLAAPQVGIPLRLIVVDVGDGPITLINPVISEASGEVCDREGCLSIPGITGLVTRAELVTAEGQDINGTVRSVRAQGLFSRALQHEIDHLDGILFIDKAKDLIREDG
ncbi:MAG: peptide deformylase [Firmicutes bacterium]|nr:peptide deformylase [Bacillota bacterium]